MTDDQLAEIQEYLRDGAGGNLERSTIDALFTAYVNVSCDLANLRAQLSAAPLANKPSVAGGVPSHILQAQIEALAARVTALEACQPLTDASIAAYFQRQMQIFDGSQCVNPAGALNF